jgi:exopolysaccharide production protein ExoZ
MQTRNLHPIQAGAPSVRKYQSIQYLRALAALVVVFHHARNPIAGLYDPLQGFGFGQAGVDIFFVISGFIMYTAARDENVTDFLRRRIIRVVPLYWIASSLLLIKNSFNKGLIKPALLDFMRSVFFIPHYSYYNPSQIWPYLTQGWTLNFEMFFYVIFSIGLYKKRLVPIISLIILLLVTTGLFVNSHSALYLTYTDPILLEFLAGIFIAKYCERTLPRFWSFLLPVGFLAIGLRDFIHGPRVLLWGIPAAMMVIGALTLERNNMLPRLKILQVLGDASYSIYLFQVFALSLSSIIVSRFPIQGPAQLLLVILSVILVSILIGMAANYFLERPITRYLSGRRQVIPRLVGQNP